MANYQLTSVAPPTGVMTAGGPGGDPSSSSDLLGTLGTLANLGGSIYGLVNASQLNSNANTVFQQSNPFGAYRPIYGKQLLDLMQNPSSVTSQPGYQFLMDQGTQALTRTAYAPGGTGAGGQLDADLMKYGQGLASQFYNQQVSELAYLAGAGISPANPAQALQGKGGAASSLGSSISGLTNSLGGTAQLLSKLFGGSGGGGGSGSSGLTPQQTADLTALFNGTYGAPANAWDSGFSNVSSSLGYDPTTGTFSGNSSPDFSQFSSSSGYSPVTGDYYSGAGSLNLNDLGGDGGNIDLSGLFSNPKTAGGEAATSNNTQPGASTMSNIGNLVGAASGILKGTPTGYASSAVDVAKLAAGNPSTVGLSQTTAHDLQTGANVGGEALGIYQGIQTGGVSGYSEAAINAAKLGSTVGLLPSAVGTVAGYLAAPLAVYNAAKNWQSGATGSDAMQGAEAGAAVGSVIPVIGTAVGAIAGAAIGALTSAFGPGALDPETKSVQNLINWTSSNNNSQAGALAVQDPYLMLQGLFDEHSSSLPIYQKYGRMNVQGFTNDMTTQINNAVRSGVVSKTDNPETIFSKVVQPWVNSMGDWSQVGTTYQNVVSGLLQNMTAEYVSGQYAADWLDASGESIGITDLRLTPFGGFYDPNVKVPGAGGGGRPASRPF